MALRVVRVASSLPLQKLLYYNSIYALAYASTHIAIAVWKGTQLRMSQEGTIVQPALVGLWVVLEALRLRLGYSGNLGERVPELAAFWLLTILPQLPVTVFMSFVQLDVLLPLEVAVGIPMAALQAGELLYGLRAVKSFIRKQTADFYRLCQEEALAKEAGLRARTMASRLPRWGGPGGAGGGGGGAAGEPGGAAQFAISALSEAELDRAVAEAGGVVGIVAEGARTLLRRGSGRAGGGQAGGEALPTPGSGAVPTIVANAANSITARRAGSATPSADGGGGRASRPGAAAAGEGKTD